MTLILSVEDLSVVRGAPKRARVAVDGLSFRVRAGTTTALISEDGAGCIAAAAVMGLLAPAHRIAAGRILFADPKRRRLEPVPVGGRPGGGPERRRMSADLTRLDPDGRAYCNLRGRHMAMMFADAGAALSPVHRVGNQVAEALRNGPDHAGRHGARAVVVKTLAAVGMPDLAQAARAYPFELPPPLRRRAALAAAVAAEPTLLIVEEPCAGQEVTEQARTLRLIQDLQVELGFALLLITRDLGVVANLADEVVVLKEGRPAESGTLHDVFYQPAHPYVRGLLGAEPQFGMDPAARLYPDAGTARKVGRLLADRPRRPANADIFPVLDLRAVSRRSDGPGTPALEPVSFQVRRGECLGLVGERGSGKRTLAGIITGTESADAGQVVFNDSGQLVNLLDLSQGERALLGLKIGSMPSAALDAAKTVAELLAELLETQGMGDAGYRRDLSVELMHLVGLDPRTIDRYPHAFTLGERRLIAVARTVATKPQLAVWIEPAAGLDGADRARVLNLIKDLGGVLELASLLVSSDPASAEYVADRMAVMCAGHVVEVAPCQTLFREPVHPYTRALVSSVLYADPSRRLALDAIADEDVADPRNWPAAVEAGVSVG